MNIEPAVGVALVRLDTSEFGSIPVPDKAHDSMTSGVVISLNKDDVDRSQHLIGRTAYWRKYRDDARIPGGVDEKLVFIEIKDILGTSYDAN